MLEWINAGFEDYAKRFPKDLPIELTEIAAEKRGNQSVTVMKEREGKRILSAIADQSPHQSSKPHIIALDVLGKSYSTEDLSQKLDQWQNEHSTIHFLIGGADGLSKECLEQSNEHWSLSTLTFPHSLVRVILIEQLYRAMSLLNNHPYHR